MTLNHCQFDSLSLGELLSFNKSIINLIIYDCNIQYDSKCQSLLKLSNLTTLDVGIVANHYLSHYKRFIVDYIVFNKKLRHLVLRNSHFLLRESSIFESLYFNKTIETLTLFNKKKTLPDDLYELLHKNKSIKVIILSCEKRNRNFIEKSDRIYYEKVHYSPKQIDFNLEINKILNNYY